MTLLIEFHNLNKFVILLIMGGDIGVFMHAEYPQIF
jgi:hypothetical protein